MLFICTFCWVLCSSFHPYYVSTTEINFNTSAKSIELTCRMFTDNLEDALKKNFKNKVDILHPKDKKEVEKLLLEYISKRLKMTVNGQSLTYELIGYEKEEDAIWTYLEVKKDIVPKKVLIENTLLYDFLPKQINMVHVTLNGSNRQSSKVNNPDKKLSFDF